MDGELALYDPVADDTLLLNAAAGRIAELCDGGRSVEDIAHALGNPDVSDRHSTSPVLQVIAELDALDFLEHDSGVPERSIDQA